jgi:Icc protein
VGSLWIDRYGLEGADSFWSLVERHPRIRCVTWGHVHQEFHIRRKGIELLGAPSSVANSLPRREKFTLDLGGPACRWLELHADGGIETGVIRAS